MHLKSLEIGGFKSFAKKTELQFLTSITGIVGPNGSGKSNVAEAFRFVLGEQSIKSMRGKRGEDLIFNGSPSVSRANRASVKIVLDNTKKIFPIDFEEISIERAVNRDGTNEYSINGTRTRLKDVQELLASANIGPTGHHIISQGEADRILSATARERREMIEDALGLKVYQFKKTESEKKLEKTKENIGHVESLRRESAPHLRFLAGQIKKMEKAIELRNELSAFYAEYLKREDEYLGYHTDRLKRERAQPEAELKKSESALLVLKEKLARGEKDEKRSALVSLEEKLRKIRDERQEALRASGRIEGETNFIVRQIEEQKRKAERAEDIRIPLSDVRGVVEVIEKEAVKANPEKPHDLMLIIERIVKSARAFLNTASRSEHFDESLRALETQHTALLKEKKIHDETLDRLSRDEESFKKEYESLRASIEAEAGENRAAEREVFEIMGRQRELAQTLADIDRELRELERDREDFKREIQEAVALVGVAAADYFKIEVRDREGAVLVREAIVAENRDRQRERRHQLEKLKIRLEELGGAGGSEVTKEYNDALARDQFLAKEIEDLTASVASLEALIRELSETLNVEFLKGIEKISEEFSTFFGLMFGGGKASLIKVVPKARKRSHDDLDEEIEESEEIEEGIEVDVQLPHKRIRGLEMLSGGERALTSIALIFAMSQVNPPLFVILDETDAALDEANSKRYGDMITSLASRSQLILITHNRETMSRAGVLYGVTMGGDGASRLLSVKFDEAVAVAK